MHRLAMKSLPSRAPPTVWYSAQIPNALPAFPTPATGQEVFTQEVTGDLAEKDSGLRDEQSG